VVRLRFGCSSAGEDTNQFPISKSSTPNKKRQALTCQMSAPSDVSTFGQQQKQARTSNSVTYASPSPSPAHAVAHLAETKRKTIAATLAAMSSTQVHVSTFEGGEGLEDSVRKELVQQIGITEQEWEAIAKDLVPPFSHNDAIKKVFSLRDELDGTTHYDSEKFSINIDLPIRKPFDGVFHFGKVVAGPESKPYQETGQYLDYYKVRYEDGGKINSSYIVLNISDLFK